MKTMHLKYSTWTLVLTLSVAGCVYTRKNVMKQDRDMVDKELSGEISLKADREQLADLRKNIPEEKRKSNDELALYLQLMKQGNEDPQMVRDKWTVLVEKHRTKFREKVQKLRETYLKDEQHRRDEFLDAQKSKRDSFTSSRHKPDDIHEFFSDQDKARQSFFADERDRRGNFESEINAQSKDFDSYMREKMNEFNEQYRLYSKAYSEKPKEKKAVTGAGDGYKQIDQVPAQPLGTDN